MKTNEILQLSLGWCEGQDRHLRSQLRVSLPARKRRGRKGGEEEPRKEASTLLTLGESQLGKIFLILCTILFLATLSLKLFHNKVKCMFSFDFQFSYFKKVIP